MSLQILECITATNKCHNLTDIVKNRKAFEILINKFATNSTVRKNAVKSLAKAIILIRRKIIMFFLTFAPQAASLFL